VKALADPPSPPSAAGPARDAVPFGCNLQGQRLGRKGRGTRERILAAAAQLLDEPPTPGCAVTLSGVARRAKLGVGSFYRYFGDLTELVLALLGPVMAEAERELIDLLRPRWPDDRVGETAAELVHAYHAFWLRHSALLHLRNSLADNRDERMMLQRVQWGRTIMRLLADQMDDAAVAPPNPIMSMAAALTMGLERVVTATTDPNLAALLRASASTSYAQLLQAEARLIELAIREGRQLAGGRSSAGSGDARQPVPDQAAGQQCRTAAATVPQRTPL
jgi:AcrR family transcriptional regulator